MPEPSTPSALQAHLLVQERRQDPRRPLMVGASATLSWGELFDRGRRFLSFCWARGLTPGDRVILATRDEGLALTAFVACLRGGLAAVLVDPALPVELLRGVLQTTGARGLVLDGARAPELPADLPRPPLFATVEAAARPSLYQRLLGKKAAVAGDTLPALLDPLAPTAHLPAAPEGAAAYLLFTSGTTSRPKGVEISHHALWTHLGTLVRQLGYDGESRILENLPLHHTDGINQGPMVALVAGATVYRPGPFSIPGVSTLVDWVHLHRISHLYTVPTVLALLDRLVEPGDTLTGSGLRLVVSSAAPLDEVLWRRFEARFGVPVANLYGLTETISGAVYSGPDAATRRVGALGFAVDCEARVVDEGGREVEAGVVGELQLRGPHLMTGYVNDPERTAQAFVDGWLRTGDLVVRDAEGALWLRGRRSRLIIRGGVNVYPEVVSAALERLPGVRGAAVLGAPDALWGERVVAVVEADGDGPGLVAALRPHLPASALPDEVLFTAALPRGPAGKVRLDTLAAKLSALRGERPHAAADVYALAARCFQVETSRLGPASSPAEIPGWSSLAHMELVTALEAAFGVRLDTRQILRIRRLGDAEDVVREARAAQGGAAP